MKRKRYSVEQIVAAVKQHELGTSAAEIARKLGIAEQTFYRWKKQYGGLERGEARELRQLREENAKLQKPSGRLRPGWRWVFKPYVGSGRDRSTEPFLMQVRLFQF